MLNILNTDCDSYRSPKKTRDMWRTMVSGSSTTPVQAHTTCTESIEPRGPFDQFMKRSVHIFTYLRNYFLALFLCAWTIRNSNSFFMNVNQYQLGRGYPVLRYGWKASLSQQIHPSEFIQMLSLTFAHMCCSIINFIQYSLFQISILSTWNDRYCSDKIRLTL